MPLSPTAIGVTIGWIVIIVLVITLPRQANPNQQPEQTRRRFPKPARAAGGYEVTLNERPEARLGAHTSSSSSIEPSCSPIYSLTMPIYVREHRPLWTPPADAKPDKERQQAVFRAYQTHKMVTAHAIDTDGALLISPTAPFIPSPPSTTDTPVTYADGRLGEHDWTEVPQPYTAGMTHRAFVHSSASSNEHDPVYVRLEDGVNFDTADYFTRRGRVNGDLVDALLALYASERQATRDTYVVGSPMPPLFGQDQETLTTLLRLRRSPTDLEHARIDLARVQRHILDMRSLTAYRTFQQYWDAGLLQYPLPNQRTVGIWLDDSADALVRRKKLMYVGVQCWYRTNGDGIECAGLQVRTAPLPQSLSTELWDCNIHHPSAVSTRDNHPPSQHHRRQPEAPPRLHHEGRRRRDSRSLSPRPEQRRRRSPSPDRHRRRDSRDGRTRGRSQSIVPLAARLSDPVEDRPQPRGRRDTQSQHRDRSKSPVRISDEHRSLLQRLNLRQDQGWSAPTTTRVGTVNTHLASRAPPPSDAELYSHKPEGPYLWGAPDRDVTFLRPGSTPSEVVTDDQGYPCRTSIPIRSGLEVFLFLSTPFEIDTRVKPLRLPWETDDGPAPVITPVDKYPVPPPDILRDGKLAVMRALLWDSRQYKYIEQLREVKPEDADEKWRTAAKWGDRLKPGADYMSQVKGLDTVVNEVAMEKCGIHPVPVERRKANLWELDTFLFRTDFERLTAHMHKGLREAPTRDRPRVWARVRDSVRRVLWGVELDYYPDSRESAFLDSTDDLYRLRYWRAVARIMESWDLSAPMLTRIRSTTGGSVRELEYQLVTMFRAVHREELGREPYVFRHRSALGLM
ncbi:uncharacterized protein B0H18DRAFT_1175729 [Fomitopsis serialis]|uniref:uncharacterized protein n=1 Tax=Fomitopsis serialis TaxID=139415 RepID=UPI00200724FD|nr:uncharacterized protein B0H18DRAFT_1175729 [Neoantrodia serialis]KAH9924377.1 hypothetical protein B0H18DRAFT_1175729 [Neoantrodia serialis]